VFWYLESGSVSQLAYWITIVASSNPQMYYVAIPTEFGGRMAAAALPAPKYMRP